MVVNINIISKMNSKIRSDLLFNHGQLCMVFLPLRRKIISPPNLTDK